VVPGWYQSQEGGVEGGRGVEWQGVKMLEERDVPSRCVWHNQYDARR
jgi:hypothetical protein